MTRGNLCAVTVVFRSRSWPGASKSVALVTTPDLRPPPSVCACFLGEFQRAIRSRGTLPAVPGVVHLSIDASDVFDLLDRSMLVLEDFGDDERS